MEYMNGVLVPRISSCASDGVGGHGGSYPSVFSPYKIKVATVHCWTWMVWNLRIFRVGRDPIRIIKSNSLFLSGPLKTELYD